MTKIVNIFWTGGWDSTFRLLQLTKNECCIQPYYIIDTDRPSTLVEIKQMSEINNDILDKYIDCTIAVSSNNCNSITQQVNPFAAP